jgi:hypothetical protein
VQAALQAQLQEVLQDVMQEVWSCNRAEGQRGFKDRCYGSEESFLEHGVLFKDGLLVPVRVGITKTSDL